MGQLHQKLRRMAVVAGTAACVLLAAGPARAVQLSPAIAQMYAAVEAVPPTASQMMVCYGFVCRLRYFLYFTPADRAVIAGMMAKGAKSAADERKALQQVFVWFDRRAGKAVGTDKRIARADIRHRAELSARPPKTESIALTRRETRSACCWCCASGVCCGITPSRIRGFAEICLLARRRTTPRS